VSLQRLRHCAALNHWFAVLVVLAKVPEPGAVKTQSVVTEGVLGFLLTRWDHAERPRRIRQRAGR
jgi:hypothetical protein